MSTIAARVNPASPLRRTLRRTFGVVAQPQSYRNIGYLLLGLPLGTIWFTALVSGLSVAASLLVVALIGIPLLWGMFYVTRWFANIERRTANALLDQQLVAAPVRSSDRGNLWARFRSMTRDRARRREIAYLMLRFPVGIATFTAAITALATPLVVAYAPIRVRNGDKHPFGHWQLSSRMEHVASSSPWSWLLVPAGLGLMVAAFHLLNALAKACGRWAAAWLA